MKIMRCRAFIFAICPVDRWSSCFDLQQAFVFFTAAGTEIAAQPAICR
jgi:hypothetical protein